LKEELNLQFERLSTGQTITWVRKMHYSLSSSKANAGTVANLAIRQRNVSQSKVKMRKLMSCAIIARRPVM
jgi:hypothetical protein